MGSVLISSNPVIIVAFIMTVIAGFLAVRALTKIDRNQSLLSKYLMNHERRISKLEAEHNILSGIHKNIREGNGND